MSPRVLRPPPLELRAIRAGWGRSDAVRGVSLRVADGERVALLGPNGAGKSTLFDVAAGRLRPRAGDVLLAGALVTALPLFRRARLGLGYVPQEPSPLLDRTVRGNLLAAIHAPAAARLAVRPTAADADRLLTAFRLDVLADRPAAVLSGGERRRMEVARALLIEPAVLLLDEPFAGLDPAGRRTLSDALAALPRGTAWVVSDHAAADALAVCERALLIEDGALVWDGPARDVAVEVPVWSRYFGA